MFLYNIFKVIYSPIKAFKEILENPRYIGVAIIIIISLFLTVGMQYVSISKHDVETIYPSSSASWSNMTQPALNWTSNGAVIANPVNYDLLVGNYSILTAIHNSSQIWLKTTDIGTVNCSSQSGFKTLYYKLMYVSASLQNLSTATLQMHSYNNETNYFEFNLLSSTGYLNKSSTWIDTNVTLASPNWTRHGGAEWANITGFIFTLNVPNNDTLSIQLNGVYFGGKYEPLSEEAGFGNWLSSTVIASAFDIFLRWLIFAALLWLTIKTFNPEGSPFKTLLIVVGYSFAVMFVYIPLDMLSVSQLPTLYFPHKVVFPASAREIALAGDATSSIYAANWTSTAPYLAFLGLTYFSYVWMAALFTVALKTLQNYSWKKAAVISVVAYIMALVIRAIIPL